MADLIDRQAAIDATHSTIFDFFDICEDDSDSPMTESDKRLLELNKAITTAIRRLPTIDPVKHGKWEKISDRNYKCSCCNAWWSVDRDSTMKDFKHCPNCGARME